MTLVARSGSVNRFLQFVRLSARVQYGVLRPRGPAFPMHRQRLPVLPPLAYPCGNTSRNLAIVSAATLEIKTESEVSVINW